MSVFEKKMDLWSGRADLRVITTNPITRGRDGAAVMGRGCAREATNRLPGIEYEFGRLLKEHGNRVVRFDTNWTWRDARIATFPVKLHWREEARIELIERSAHQLVRLADKFFYKNVLLPRPGCGNGRLRWQDVRAVLEEILDDRFTVVHK